MANTNIHESEWEDVDAELRRRRRTRDEFDWKEEVAPLRGTGIQPLRGMLTVRNLKTGVACVYQTGHGSVWVTDFLRDLDARML